MQHSGIRLPKATARQLVGHIEGRSVAFLRDCVMTCWALLQLQYLLPHFTGLQDAGKRHPLLQSVVYFSCMRLVLFCTPHRERRELGPGTSHGTCFTVAQPARAGELFTCSGRELGTSQAWIWPGQTEHNECRDCAVQWLSYNAEALATHKLVELNCSKTLDGVLLAAPNLLQLH